MKDSQTLLANIRQDLQERLIVVHNPMLREEITQAIELLADEEQKLEFTMIKAEKPEKGTLENLTSGQEVPISLKTFSGSYASASYRQKISGNTN